MSEPEINLQSTILNGVWIQETYSGSVKSSKGGSMTLRRDYILRKKGDNPRNKTQEMHQTEAYAALQSFILQYQYGIDYQTNEGTVKLWTSNINVDVDKNNYPVYKGEVTWEFDPHKPNYLLQPVTWSHRMSSGTRKLSKPVLPQRHYTLPGVPPISYPGVNWDAEKQVFEGVECYSPEWRMIAKQQLLANTVTQNYLLMLMWMSKTTNALPFRGFPPGTVLYLGADMEEAMVKDNRVVDLTHQFVIEPNMENFFYEGIHVDMKGGHEFLWVSSYVKTFDVEVDDEESEESARGGQVVGPAIYQINVAPMYGKTDLNLLGLS